ncbi:multidrug ABC transporter permease [Paenibacillus beijingensis]|uniref:Multidrug ABC transporter permease n=1 Tax=Paenibacillus beijingensis TaxID=1126833 RepID=A0A0D5NRV8_9BACL|nr:multidrug ABC transporter permease [Paenibacillus beijingensis]
MKASGSWRAFFALIRDTRPSKLLIASALSLSIVSTIVGLIVPMFTKNLVDGFSLTSIGTMQVVMLVAVFLAQALTSALSTYLLARIGQGVVAKLRDRLWRKLLILPVSYFDRHPTGETVSRMTNDTGVVKGLISEHLTGFATGIISIIGSLIILLSMDWKMTLILLAAVPLLLSFMVPLGRKMHKVSKGLQDETAHFAGVLSGVLSEMRLVKASGSESREYEEGFKGIRKLFRFGLQEGGVSALIGPAVSFTMMMLLIIIIGYGGVRVTSGEMTAGGLVAFILYLFQIMFPVSQLGTFFTQMQKAVGATERINETLRAEEEDFNSGKELARIGEQAITAENLVYGYGEDEPVIQGIDFTLPPGKVTAVVGPSGGGKTTLFSLLERYYSPSGGSIRIGGEPIGAYSLKSWRSRIGYVSQESPLMAGTIRENITYGVEREVSDEELKRVAAMAYADRFIEEFPHGYDTEVGERGIKLSGGQRQRIGIARALMRDPELLLLDEATSSLDSKSEAVVQEALGNLMAGRTTVVIAHRLSTVVDADQILFIEKGRITGRGTHAELLRSHALYREFAEHQLKQAAGRDENEDMGGQEGQEGQEGR